MGHEEKGAGKSEKGKGKERANTAFKCVSRGIGTQVVAQLLVQTAAHMFASSVVRLNTKVPNATKPGEGELGPSRALWGLTANQTQAQVTPSRFRGNRR